MNAFEVANQFARLQNAVVYAAKEGVFDSDSVAGGSLVFLHRLAQFGYREGLVDGHQHAAQLVIGGVERDG